MGNIIKVYKIMNSVEKVNRDLLFAIFHNTEIRTIQVNYKKQV